MPILDRENGSSGQGGEVLNETPAAPSAHYLPLFAESADAVIVADAAGHCVAANAAAALMLGYSQNEIRALALTDLIAGGRDCAAGECAHLLDGGRWSGVVQVRRKDRRLVNAESWATAVAAQGGNISILFLRELPDLDDFEQSRSVQGANEDAATDVVVEMTPAGEITSWGLAAERLYGYSAREVVGQSFTTFTPPELAGDVSGLLDQVRRGRRVAAYRTVQFTRSGCRIDVCLAISPVCDAAGGVVAIASTVRDVLGCRRVERELQAARASARESSRALRESEERFRGAFTGASIGMALVAPDGRFLQVNPALCGIMGYREEELLATTFQDITHPADIAADRHMADRLLAGEIDTYQIEKQYLRQDGDSICGRLTVSLVRDAEANPLYFVSQVQDITPYKAAGRALREAEARYRTLVEQIPAAVYADAGNSLGTPVYISPQIEALLGYTPEEWVADPDLWVRAIHADDRERIVSALASAGGGEQAMHLEYRCLARDGREVWVHDQVALVRDEDGVAQYWQGFMVDVTARKRAEEALRAAKEAAEEASRLKSAFLSMATHELRTPLTIISGYVELLAESATPHLTPDEQEFLDVAQTGTRTLTALVDDLLDLARMEAGRLDLAIRPVDVREAMDGVHRLVAAQAAAKGIVLDVDVPSGLPPVAGDLTRLVQVLFNLLGNAIKFTEHGTVWASARAVAHGVEISVTDTGIGIPPDALPRIFDEFHQADTGTTRKFGGSGLGLAIAKRLVEMQGGAITVESNVGEGSTFAVWLPVADQVLDSDGGLASVARDATVVAATSR